MAIRYTDQEIGALVQERKTLPADWRNQFVTRIRRGSKERHLDLTGTWGINSELLSGRTSSTSQVFQSF